MPDQIQNEIAIDPQWKVSSEEISKSMLQEYLKGNNEQAKIRLNLKSDDGIDHSGTIQKMAVKQIDQENETRERLLQTVGLKPIHHPVPGLFIEFTLRHPSALDSYEKQDPTDLHSDDQTPIDHAVIPTQQLISQHNKNYPELTLKKVF